MAQIKMSKSKLKHNMLQMQPGLQKDLTKIVIPAEILERMATLPKRKYGKTPIQFESWEDKVILQCQKDHSMVQIGELLDKKPNVVSRRFHFLKQNEVKIA